VIPEAAVEAAARAMAYVDPLWPDAEWEDVPDRLRDQARGMAGAALEAAAPYITEPFVEIPDAAVEVASLKAQLARVNALADAWEARGEHDMAVAKIIKDEHISEEILGSGAQMVENARHIRIALGGAK